MNVKGLTITDQCDVQSVPVYNWIKYQSNYYDSYKIFGLAPEAAARDLAD